MKAAKAAKASSRLHAELLQAFGREWAETYGEDYIPSSRDKSQLGRLLASLKGRRDVIALLPNMFRLYVRDGSKFVGNDLRNPLWFFCTNDGVNKYRTDPPRAATGNGARDITRGHARPSGDYGKGRQEL